MNIYSWKIALLLLLTDYSGFSFFSPHLKKQCQNDKSTSFQDLIDRHRIVIWNIRVSFLDNIKRENESIEFILRFTEKRWRIGFQSTR